MLNLPLTVIKQITVIEEKQLVAALLTDVPEPVPKRWGYVGYRPGIIDKAVFFEISQINKDNNTVILTDKPSINIPYPIVSEIIGFPTQDKQMLKSVDGISKPTHVYTIVPHSFVWLWYNLANFEYKKKLTNAQDIINAYIQTLLETPEYELPTTYAGLSKPIKDEIQQTLSYIETLNNPSSDPQPSSASRQSKAVSRQSSAISGPLIDSRPSTAQGGKPTPTYKASSKKVKVGSAMRIVYLGKRGGEYIKRQGEFVPLRLVV